MKIAPGSKLVMIGDSITDAGRAQPVGEGRVDKMGNGYVCYVDGLLQAAYPKHRIRVVNMGTSGHTVRDLKARWQRDVLDLGPDWLSIMIGINDVWRQFDQPRQPEVHVLPQEYEQTLAELVETTRPQLKGLVLMTPYFIELRKQDPMRARMDQYGALVKKLARRHNAILVDTQAAFNEVLEFWPAAGIAWDRVHPSHIGHMILARAFLKAIGYAW